MPTQNVLLQVVMHSKFGANGWSDKFFLPHTTFAAAATAARNLTLWRKCALAPGCTLVWSRMSFVDTPRNTIACLNSPLPAQAYGGSVAGEIEDVYTALHYRFETADGQWANRLFRGISDPAVSEMSVQPNVDPTWYPLPPDTPYPDAQNLATAYPDIFKGFLEFARRNTVHAVKLPGPTVAWEVTPWAKVIFRKVANRQTGIAFGTTRGRARKRAPVA